MKSEMRVKALVVAALLISMLTAYAVADGPSDGLATPESFSAIGDTAHDQRRCLPSSARF